LAGQKAMALGVFFVGIAFDDLVIDFAIQALQFLLDSCD